MLAGRGELIMSVIKGDSVCSKTSIKKGEILFLPGQSPEGEYILSVLVKRTYNILPDKPCVRAESDNSLIPGDVSWDNPMNSTVEFESDFVPYKLGTDIVLNGKAYAPSGVACQSLTASIQIGDNKKNIKVIGNRHAEYIKDGVPHFTEPVPFVEMGLRYEKAYGGIDVYSNKETTYPYPRNMLGQGFVVSNTKESVDKLKLPNIEDPNDLLTPERLCLTDYDNWERQPMPAGFGWLPKHYKPRADFAGIMPADRQAEQELRGAYAKLVPKEERDAYLNNKISDMNFHFFNGASKGLAMHYLSGSELITTINLSKEGKTSFELPDDNPKIGIDIGEGVQKTEAVIHTVMIHMEEEQVDIVWRGAIKYPGPDWLSQMPKLEIVIT